MKYRILAAVLLLALGAVMFQTQWYRMRPRVVIPAQVLTTLQTLAEQALANREVPVGAVLVYEDSIIGRGFNTVVRDSNLSAHAEINALIDAHRSHRELWKHMDRSKLVVYSTYEPCDMCKGAMLNLNITHAVFEGRKPAREQLAGTWKGWGYEWQKRRLNSPGMQDSLFWRHPDFPGK